jgi:flagellar basal body P-ring formation protein FlgA
VLNEPFAQGGPRNGRLLVAAYMQGTGLRTRNGKGLVHLALISCGGKQHRQIQIVERGGLELAQSGVLKVPVHQIQLLEHTELQNALGVLAIAHTGSTAVGTATELNDPMTVAVGGPGIEAIALHHGHASEVVRRKPMLSGHVDNSSLDVAHLPLGNVALGHRPIEQALEHSVPRCAGGLKGKRSNRLNGGGLNPLLGRKHACKINDLPREDQVWVFNFVGFCDGLDHRHQFLKGRGRTSGMRLLTGLSGQGEQGVTAFDRDLHDLLQAGPMPEGTTLGLIFAFSQGMNQIRHLVCALLLLAAPAAASAVAPSANEVARDALQHAAQMWVLDFSPLGAEKPQVLLPERRIDIKACANWQFDLPFGPGQGLRAKCAKPKQQIFLTLEQRVERPAKSPKQSPLAEQPAAVAQPEPVSRQTVVVAKQAIRPLQALSTTQFELLEKEVPAHISEPVLSLQDLNHQQLTRPLKAGEILLQRDLRPAVLVKRGQVVTVSIQPGPGLTITARLEAQEDGRAGQSIRFKNPQSGRILNATVIGPGEARTS